MIYTYIRVHARIRTYIHTSLPMADFQITINLSRTLRKLSTTISFNYIHVDIDYQIYKLIIYFVITFIKLVIEITRESVVTRSIFICYHSWCLLEEQRWFIQQPVWRKISFFLIEIIKVEIDLDFSYSINIMEIVFSLAYRYSKSPRKGHPLATCISASPAQIHPSHTATNIGKYSLLRGIGKKNYNLIIIKIWSNSTVNNAMNRRASRKRGGYMIFVVPFCKPCKSLLPSTRSIFQHFNFWCKSKNCAVIATIRDCIIGCYCLDTVLYLRSYDTFAYCIYRSASPSILR